MPRWMGDETRRPAAKDYEAEAMRAAGRGDMAMARSMRRRSENAKRFDEDMRMRRRSEGG